MIDPTCMKALANLGMDTHAEALVLQCELAEQDEASMTFQLLEPGETPEGEFTAELTVTIKRVKGPTP